MRITDFVEQYRRENDICDKTCDQYRIAARLLARFAGDVEISSLDDDLINDWLAWLGEGRAKRTVSNYRRSILTMWRHAHATGRHASLPTRVKQIRLPESIPEAWSAAEATQLVEAAEKTRGWFRQLGCRRSDWFRCFVLLDWDTALRLSDLLSLEDSDVATGVVSIVQGKTGYVHRCQLRPETIDAATLLRGSLRDYRTNHRGQRRYVLPLWGNRNAFYYHFRKLVRSAGLGKGTSKWIRRSSATAVEAIQPGAAMRHLGHRTPGLAYRHYVDPRLIDDQRPMPPPITG